MRASCAVLAVLVLAGSGLAPGSEPAEPDAFVHRVRPVLERYCWDCHDQDARKGGLDLTPELAGPAGGRVWRAVLMRLESGEMPPRRKDQPSADERRAVVDWILA